MGNATSRWTERVAQWRASDQSMEAYSIGQPYQVSTLRYWESRLRLHGTPAVRRQWKCETSPPTKRTMPDAPRMAPVVAMPSARACELVVEIGEARIVLRRGFDADLLRDVAHALRGER